MIVYLRPFVLDVRGVRAKAQPNLRRLDELVASL